MARYLTRRNYGHAHTVYIPETDAPEDEPVPVEEHTHDGLYAPGGHEHLHDHDTDYAPSAHGHDTSHDHTGLYAPAHSHPYATDDHVHPGGDATHPDLASHVSLGLTADSHSHPHDHDGEYATPHAHDFAASGHTHQEAAHDHDADYAASVHAHDTTHDHDGTYSAQGHGHTAAEVGASATGHTHDTSHNHDASYEAVGHDHDTDYSPTGHAHVHDHDGTYATDSHSHSLTEQDIPSGIARDAEVTAAIATHAATPHGGESGEAYAVGDLYLTTTNHADGAAVATHFGYGTWERFGVGRFLLLTDQTAGTAGGSATHSHTFTQPAAHIDVITHTHTTDSQGAHVHDQTVNSATTGGLSGYGARDTSTNTAAVTDYDTGSAGAHTHTAAAPAGAVASIAHTGGAVANGSTDPLSISAYAWKRTA